MRALQGKQEVDMSKSEFASFAGEFQGIDLDVGTGDGRFVLDRATAHPERLIVGMDPVAGAMEAAANRITRRRTRQKNALFIVASVEQMPPELHGAFDHVFVNLPWGSLMRGLILGDPEILEPLAAVGKPGAEYTITLNLRVFSNPVPIEVQDLPEVTADYVNTQLIEPYRLAGLEITDARLLNRDDLDTLRTTWARRLSHERPPPSIEIKASRMP